MDSILVNVCDPKYQIFNACPKKGLLAHCLPVACPSLARCQLPACPRLAAPPRWVTTFGLDARSHAQRPSPAARCTPPGKIEERGEREERDEREEREEKEVREDRSYREGREEIRSNCSNR